MCNNQLCSLETYVNRNLEKLDLKDMVIINACILYKLLWMLKVIVVYHRKRTHFSNTFFEV